MAVLESDMSSPATAPAEIVYVEEKMYPSCPVSGLAAAARRNKGLLAGMMMMMMVMISDDDDDQ